MSIIENGHYQPRIPYIRAVRPDAYGERAVDASEMASSAQAARDDAIQARDLAEGYAQASEDAKTSSVSASNAAISAEAGAAEARTNSEAAQTNAEAAQAAAEIAAANAQSSALTFAEWDDGSGGGLLNAIGSTDGEGAEVLDSDTGTHLAASGTGYDGASVSNSGRYSWNAAWSRWVRIGGTGLSAKAAQSDLDLVEADVSTITRASINLFNHQDPDYLVDFRLNPPNGLPVALSGWITTGFIPVSSGVTYTHNFSNVYTMYYNTSKSFVSALADTTVDGYLTNTAPGDGFIRLSVQLSAVGSDETNQFVVAGSGAPTSFEDFGPLVDHLKFYLGDDERVAANALGPRSSAMWETGKNLANPVGRVDGYYLSLYGKPVANATYSYWPLFPVSPGLDYVANQSMRFVTFFDVGGKAVNSISIGSSVSSFTAPDGAAYAGVTSNQSGVATFQVEQASVATAYEAFRYQGRTALPTGEPLAWGSPGGAQIVSDIDAELASTAWRSAAARPALYGVERLRETRQRLRSLRMGVTGLGARLTIALIGDSYTHDNGRYSYKVHTTLLDNYLPGRTYVQGPTGLGWISFKGAGSGSFPNGAIYWNNYVTGSGTWTSENGTADSPDSGSETSSTPGDYLEPAVDWDYDLGFDYSLFAEGGSGVVRYRWTAAGSWTTVDLSALSAGVQVISMPSPPASGTGRFRIEVVSGTCKLYGVYQRHPTAEGIVTNKLGGTGTTAAQWAALNAADWQTGIAALAPNLVLILHGTNDQASRTKAQFKADLLTIIDRVRTARPTADVLLVAPPENGLGRSLAMSEYADAMYEIARDDRDVACLDLQPYFGVQFADYEFGSDRPWYASDDVHPDPATGGYAMTDAILSALAER